MADVSGLVGRLQGCRIVDLRARRLAPALLGGRPTLEGDFARRISGYRHACRRRVVSASSPHRTAVAGCAGSLRRTGTGEGDLPMEELAALSPGFGSRAERRLLSLGRRSAAVSSPRRKALSQSALPGNPLTTSGSTIRRPIPGRRWRRCPPGADPRWPWKCAARSTSSAASRPWKGQGSLHHVHGTM